MKTDRELLQQALDALETCTPADYSTGHVIHPSFDDRLVDAAIVALEEALAAPQPEPEKRIVWCTETDSACSTCPTLRIPCQAATQAAALNARVTVPREPTQEMIAAGEAVFRSYCFRHVNGAIPTYEAMIAAAPAPAEDFCYCNDDISLQIVSGGAAKEGLYGRVTLLIDGKYVDYVPAESANPAVPMTEEQIRSIYRKTLNQSLREQDTSVVLQFARAVLSAAPAVPLTDTRKLCTCDGAGRGPGRACVVQAGGRLGELWKCAKSAAPAVREPQDERIRWRDAVIKEAESALRTAEQEFADMPTWANVGHAAKKVTHALAVIAALGIGGGGDHG